MGTDDAWRFMAEVAELQARADYLGYVSPYSYRLAGGATKGAGTESEGDPMTIDEAVNVLEIMGHSGGEPWYLGDGDALACRLVLAELARLRSANGELLDELDMSNGCLNMVAARLAVLGCQHADGHGTPPMMYDDWISCCVGKRDELLKDGLSIFRNNVGFGECWCETNTDHLAYGVTCWSCRARAALAKAGGEGTE